MRVKEWIILLIFVSLAIVTSNILGNDSSFAQSIPGALILCGIALLSVLLQKAIPVNFPVVMYCSILGLLLASPISPVREVVVSNVMNIGFKAPLSIVGAFAGISMGKDYKSFLKQGWKMVVLTILILTGTFVGSAVVAHIVLNLTNAV